jgi:hypothetical protein
MPGVRCERGHYGRIRRSESGRRDRASTRSGILIVVLSRFNRDGTLCSISFHGHPLSGM